MITPTQAMYLSHKCLSLQNAVLDTCLEDRIEEIYQLTLIESCAHEDIRPRHLKRGMTLIQEAQYFMIKRIIEQTSKTNHPNFCRYFSTQKSIYAAYALVNPCADEDRDQIAALLDTHGPDMWEISRWEYSTLMEYHSS